MLYQWFYERRVIPRAMDRAVARVREIDNKAALQRKILAEPWFHGNQSSHYFDAQPFIKRMREID
ncbi:MAG: hypothetical protein R3F37_07005 [Candidatus Competibacteraceae bacterium]